MNNTSLRTETAAEEASRVSGGTSELVTAPYTRRPVPLSEQEISLLEISIEFKIEALEQRFDSYSECPHTRPAFIAERLASHRALLDKIISYRH